MKKVLFILFLSMFSLNIMSQTNTTTTKRVKATESMCRKIEIMCSSSRLNLAERVFYESNKKFLTINDILAGKGDEILKSLYRYPEYSENFLREVYNIWGYKGFKDLGFTDEEIIIAKKIINNPLK